MAAGVEKKVAQVVAARAAHQEAAAWLDDCVLTVDLARAELECCQADLAAVTVQTAAGEPSSTDERCMEVDDEETPQTPEEAACVRLALVAIRAARGGTPALCTPHGLVAPAASTPPSSKQRLAQRGTSPLSVCGTESDTELTPDSPLPSEQGIYGKCRGRGTSTARVDADPYSTFSPVTPQSVQQAAADESSSQVAVEVDQHFRKGAALQAQEQ